MKPSERILEIAARCYVRADGSFGTDESVRALLDYLDEEHERAPTHGTEISIGPVNIAIHGLGALAPEQAHQITNAIGREVLAVLGKPPNLAIR